MQRSLQEPIIEAMSEKIVIILGPRQCGKTALSKMLNDNFDYFNYDFAKHRLELKETSWDRDKKPHTAIEVKLSDQTPSKAFNKLIRFKKPVNMIQIVKNLEKVKSYPSGVKIKSAIDYLQTACFEELAMD